MVFNSLTFVFFFSIVFLLLLILQIKTIQEKPGKTSQTIKKIILLLGSYIFYGWWDWRFAFLMLALTVVAYICSLRSSQTQGKWYAYISFIAPLIILCFFKYFNFFVDTFATAFGIERVNTLNIILPVGISFYTFQSLSYSIDVYRGKIRAERNFINLSLYIAFFPQLVAGPIVKASDFIPQLYEDRKINFDSFEQGISLFVFGLFKKIVLADNLALCVDSIFGAPTQYHAVSLIFAVIAYSIQIYCDFSGYSDMAIGCAKCLGYDLQKNFNLPYISQNVSEFWKRWHISLSTWLQEYLYIPLGGNRCGKIKTYINLFITMVLGGLWHGASWTFVAWGAIHGVALCIHKAWISVRSKDASSQKNIVSKVFSVFFTYVFVSFCWIFFRAETFAAAGSIVRGILCWQEGIMFVGTWTIVSMSIVGIATIIPFVRAVKTNSKPEGYYPRFSLTSISGLTALFATVGIALVLAYTGNSPFIYFQF